LNRRRERERASAHGAFYGIAEVNKRKNESLRKHALLFQLQTERFLF
jgi:hypothetical protein